MDFALGSAIADDIVPSALKYYTGQAALEDEDDDDEDEEDDDDDGDDDDDDADGPPLPGKGNPECTQQ
jgi:nucleosome assembly protein 1-like 1